MTSDNLTKARAELARKVAELQIQTQHGKRYQAKILAAKYNVSADDLLASWDNVG